MFPILRLGAAMLVIGAALSPLTASAVDETVVARSDNLDIEIRAGADWCAAKAELRLVHGPASKIVGKEHLLLQKLDPVFSEDCPAMETADVTIVAADGRAGEVLTIAKIEGWKTVARRRSANTTTNTTADRRDEAKSAEQAEKLSEPSSDTVDAASQPAKGADAMVEAVPLTDRSLYLTILNLRPELKQNAEVLETIAADLKCREYRKVENNEFERRKWFQRETADLIEAAHAVAMRLTLRRKVRAGEYDFDKQAFPFKLYEKNGIYQHSVDICGWSYRNRPIDAYHRLKFPEVEIVDRLPMSPDRAKVVARKMKERYDNDRYVIVEYTVELTEYLGKLGRYGKRDTYGINLIDATVMGIDKASTVIARYDAAEIAARLKARRLEAARAEAEAEAARKATEAAAQKDRIRREATALYQRNMLDDPVARAAFVAGTKSPTSPMNAIARAADRESLVPFRALVLTGDGDGEGTQVLWPARLHIERSSIPIPERTWIFLTNASLRSVERDAVLRGEITVEALIDCGDSRCNDEVAVRAAVKRQLPSWDGMLAGEGGLDQLVDDGG